MASVRSQLRGLLTARRARVHRRWLHPNSGCQPYDRFPNHRTCRANTGRGRASADVQNLNGMPYGHSGVSGSVYGGTSLRFRHGRLEWPCRPDNDHAHRA
jgi:hypothetical protein